MVFVGCWVKSVIGVIAGCFDVMLSGIIIITMG